MVLIEPNYLTLQKENFLCFSLLVDLLIKDSSKDPSSMMTGNSMFGQAFGVKFEFCSSCA